MVEKNNKVENVIIIGGGPAGLAAAVYNARAQLSPLVFTGSPPGGQLILTSEVENYPGFESILGPELIEKMREQAKKFGARLIDENVAKVDFSKRPFEIFLHQSSTQVLLAPRGPVGPQSQKSSRLRSSLETSTEPYLAKSVLIATGAKAMWLGLESEERLRGRGVSACATCDGFFFRNKTVAVVGGGDTAMEEALTLTKFATKVYLLHRRDSFRASKVMQQRVLSHPKIEVMWNTGVTEVLGENKVEGVKLDVRAQMSGVRQPTSDIRNLAIDGLFIAIGHKPDTDLFKEQIVLDEKGYVITSERMAEYCMREQAGIITHPTIERHEFNYSFPSMTSVTGVFAAGDCVDHMYRQAATAAGMGVAAALEIERFSS